MGVAFSELRSERHALLRLCALHEASLGIFSVTGAPWFKLEADERVGQSPGEKLKHLTTTASCYQSLLDAELEDSDALRQRIDAFSKSALDQPSDRWLSDQSGHTYCRVRTLPLILEHASRQVVAANDSQVINHLKFIWSEVRPALDRQGIREHAKKHEKDHNVLYPPNAFLTYWALRTLRAAGQHDELIQTVSGLEEKAALALSWSERILGAQVALASAKSDQADPQQLGWALATVVRFSDEASFRQPARLDLIRQGLKSFFLQQSEAGGWSKGEPLFHFQRAGNAHCYTFETLMELVRPAVHPDARVFRGMLQEHIPDLLKAWRFGDRAKEELGAGAVGWCSRHHPHRTEPESWATASAFSFIQLLRALVGYWTRSSAANELNVQKPRWLGEKAREKLSTYGETWDWGSGWSVAQQLAAFFLNPILANETVTTSINPDLQLLQSDQARGAILFGPPGTGKTTLVEALAGALGWDFIEIHASDFLREGMDNVPSRADQIFQYVMELDRAVVLFDEIDELVRDRSDASDPFGRFLTTSMLPKLAKLWDQRRVLYFLNTNWVDRADPAIRRGQRFDASIFVPPPAFGTKLSVIGDLLDSTFAAELHDKVDAALDGNASLTSVGWLGLLRYDQLSELRDRLAVYGGGATEEQLGEALKPLAQHLEKTDWQLPVRTAGSDSNDESKVPDPFRHFRELTSEEAFDHARVRCVRFSERVEPLPDGYRLRARPPGGEAVFVVLPAVASPAPRSLEGAGWLATADQVLWFNVERT